MEKVRTHDVIAERRNASIQPVVESQRVSDIMRERMARGGHCEHNTIYRETTTQPNDITEISGNDEFHSANQITWPKYVSVCAQRMNGKNTSKNHEWVGRNRFFFFSPFPFTFLQMKRNSLFRIFDDIFFCILFLFFGFSCPSSQLVEGRCFRPSFLHSLWRREREKWMASLCHFY